MNQVIESLTDYYEDQVIFSSCMKPGHCKEPVSEKTKATCTINIATPPPKLFQKEIEPKRSVQKRITFEGPIRVIQLKQNDNANNNGK